MYMHLILFSFYLMLSELLSIEIFQSIELGMIEDHTYTRTSFSIITDGASIVVKQTEDNENPNDRVKRRIIFALTKSSPERLYYEFEKILYKNK
ncbi:hypothetical protein V1478_017678 [Vespula squamosa]|uniref:Uncharacterized protein n=1 Tax=Vespula squamosa TaxID=30214 RepID=A0ABD1ZWJ0_VESSQ